MRIRLSGTHWAATLGIHAIRLQLRSPAENFTDLEVAWEWDGASFGAISGRSTPSLINGKLITVAGNKRYVVALDPKSGETLWSYREPDTPRAFLLYARRLWQGRGLRQYRW